MTRIDGRGPGELRPITIERGFVVNAPGSVLFRAGATAVLVTAHLADSVPPFLEGKGVGWLTAEYSMLPGSTPTRGRRGGDGRATEIQRLIGRSLRAIVDRQALGPWTIHVDADVINADGGTRTAAITAAFIAVADALKGRFPEKSGAILRDSIAAVSTGIIDGVPVLDLSYPEDSRAEVDMNVVRLGNGGLVEVQGTGEGGVFSRAQLQELLDLAESGMDQLGRLQRRALGESWPWPEDGRFLP
jgi:ribonuclease PH